MMKYRRDHVRRSFAAITAIVLLVAVGTIFRLESDSVAQYTATQARVIAIEVGPRTRKAVLAIEAGGRTHKTVANLVLFSQLQHGQSLQVRYDPGNVDNVKIDSFGYIHATSLGLTAGMLVLFVVLAAAVRRRSGRNPAGG